MSLAIKPLVAAPQPTAYPQPKRDDISAGAKLTWLVGILTLTLFGGGFFALLLAGHRGYGSFNQPYPLANRASRRDVCTDTYIGVPIDRELTFAASHVLGSHYLARGQDGKYLQTWMVVTMGQSRYRLIDTALVPGAVMSTQNTGTKSAGIGWSNGDYDFFSVSGGTGFAINRVHIESTPISSAGIAGTRSFYNFTSSSSDFVPLLSLVPLPSGEAALCASNGSPSSYNWPWLHVYNASGNRTTFQVDSEKAYSTLVSCSALSNSNIVYFWKNSELINGIVVTKTNEVVVPKKTVLSLTASALASTALSNQKVVLAWIDSATLKVAFQIMDATLSNPSAVFVADPCSSGAQSEPQLMNFWDGFVLVLTSDDESGSGVFGYRFGPDGTPVGGRFPLNSYTIGDQTNPVIAPLGSSGIYTGWSFTNTTLVTRPFDLNRAPFINAFIPPQSAPAGNLFSLNLTGYIEDPDTLTGFDNLTFSIFDTPPWLSFNAETLTAYGTPDQADTETRTLIFRGDDLYGKWVNQSFTLTTNNKAPYIAWQPNNAQFALNSYVHLPLDQVFKDPEGFPVNVTVKGNPSWLALTNQILSGIASAYGHSMLNITGTDPFGASNFTSFTIDVIPGGTSNPPPQVSALIASITKEGGTSFTYAIPSDAFIDVNGNPLTYFASLPNNVPLPSWLLFDQHSGIFTGSPTNANAGGYIIVITAVDLSGAAALQTFMMTIKDSTKLSPYVANPMPATTAFVGQLFQQYVGHIFADPNDGDIVTLTASFSPAVTWITFDPTKASLSGIPGHGDVFPVSAVLIARDKSGLSASSTVTINVQGDNWFITIFKIVGPIFSVLGALATIYKYRHQIRDYTVLLKRKITPINSQKAIALASVSQDADDAQPLQGDYQAFNDDDDKA